MTITNTVSKTTALGNGATTSFTFNFLIPASGDEQVIFTDDLGNQTVLTNTQYTLSGFGNSAGGSVLYPLTGSPIAAGTSLTIARILPLVQLTSLSNQGAFYPTVVESALDYEMMINQQIAEAEARNLQAPIVDATPPGPLPAIAQRAGMVLGFDGGGNPIAVSTAPAGAISSAMAPVVNASTLANGRAAFGLGAAATEGIGAGLADDGAGKLRVIFTPVTVSANTSVTASNHLNQFIVTATANLSLSKASTLFPGFCFRVFGAGATGALVPNAADSIQRLASGASFPVLNGAAVDVITDGVASWFLSIPNLILSEITTPSPPPTGNIALYAIAGDLLAMLNPTGTQFVLGKDPTTRNLTSGSGTYTPTSGTVRIRVRMVGGGGGGAGGGTGAAGGGTGGTTSLGGWTCIGGTGGAAGGIVATLGGTGGADGVGTRIRRITGSAGSASFVAGATISAGGYGGNSPLTGAGVSLPGNSAGNGAVANSGSGGAGGTAAGSAGSGGGAGEYVEFYVSLPGALSFVVGAAGLNGLGGAVLGGAGGAGNIIIEEFYN